MDSAALKRRTLLVKHESVNLHEAASVVCEVPHTPTSYCHIAPTALLPTVIRIAYAIMGRLSIVLRRTVLPPTVLPARLLLVKH